VPSGNPTQVYFVELLLKQNGNLVDRNVYWLSTQPDVVSWSKTLGQPQGTLSQYANLQALQTLPQSSIWATAATTRQAGDNELQSSLWQDNDITLFPGESQTLTASYNSADLQGATPVISVSGWNVPKIDIAAPVP
jgi:exo-1,4-beta-D-glucosaminidase